MPNRTANNRNVNWKNAVHEIPRWPMYEPNKAQIESAARRAMPPEIGVKSRLHQMRGWIVAGVFIGLAIIFSVLIWAQN